MNVLLLSNNAPNYFYFFNHLAQLIHKDGAEVTVAVDSEISRENNKINALGFPVYEFSSFFRSHKTDHDILARYSEYNLNSTLLSDYERAQVYRIWGEKDDEYFNRLKSALLTFWEKIFDERKIDIVLYENVSNTFSHLAWLVAQRKGKRYIGIGGSRLPGRFSISSDPLNDSRTSLFFSAIKNSEVLVPDTVKDWAENYLANIENIVPDYMKINGLDNVKIVSRYFNTEKIKLFLRLIKHRKDESYYSFQAGNPVKTYMNLFSRNLMRKIKTKRLKKYYDESRCNESFLLYPMHFHPESSTSILAGTYLDEYEVIRNIAFNLPEGMKLYVKDHMSAWGYPSIEFYKKLKKLPNVRVLSPNEATKQLIKRSRAVITLTSTVGYEALLLGKKVFLYGEVFYNFHRNVVKIKSPADLFNILNENLKDEVIVSKKYTLDFLAACYLATYPGSLNLMLKDENARRKAEEIYNKVIKEIIFSDLDAIKNKKLWL
ncbi:hypothetical protein ACQE32_02645 [Pantoea sp. FN0302]|uniref:capsular polysaccharide export protein, LipB/KpsS family n=1 Tax=Pantoea sp. FN0302 TaxID=3418558 RepID=UPI003CF987CF